MRSGDRSGVRGLIDIPLRIFLDSSALQSLQRYGAYIYENEPLDERDPILRDSRGVLKLDALRNLMLVAERAPFQFALSENSFAEVRKKRDQRYLQWAYDVLDHWLACLAESDEQISDTAALALRMDTSAFGYLGEGDRILIRDALRLRCDTFLTMENKLPKQANHLREKLGIQVASPIETWERVRPWAALFR